LLLLFSLCMLIATLSSPAAHNRARMAKYTAAPTREPAPHRMQTSSFCALYIFWFGNLCLPLIASGLNAIHSLPETTLQTQFSSHQQTRNPRRETQDV
jgi:hypothetical protein